ncbi:MAG: AAA family ATPase [Paracoccaceae bacterium]|nr:AAA family ATPase [Paracoccaceae bacterium]
MELSLDQKECLSKLKEFLNVSGLNFKGSVGNDLQAISFKENMVAVLGYAGSGKTEVLRVLVETLENSDVNSVNIDFETKRKEGMRCYAILAPTNKAVSVLKTLGVRATTLHRVLYSPLYDPNYEKISDWLQGLSAKPSLDAFNDKKLENIKTFFSNHPSIPGALASVGVRTSDFIIGWKRRENPLDIGIVDESSMLTQTQVEDLKKIFRVLILFGDPGQLSPVEQSGRMVFHELSDKKKFLLTKIHRQSQDNPIIQLTNFLRKSQTTYEDFNERIKNLSKIDNRIVVSSSVCPDLMCRSPVLVWRNQTRIRLISAFRKAFDIPDNLLITGEPLICDGIELPSKYRKKRIDLEDRGLIKGAQAIYIGKGKKSGFCKLFVVGASEPNISVASIVQMERTGQQTPNILSAAGMGVLFVHGAATTIHKAQGSQWPEVQVFSPDIEASAKSGLIESDIPLWKRLAYVAITRAQEKLFWVTNYRIANAKGSIRASDLVSSNVSKFECET